ncbi:RodZ domain-containing protein [Bacillus sp. V3B]|uniref:helix-turn-helix domain-containing protein n=1 Tax=Bacillus sp. V3B TaxID=2804915 RepID=UPI0028117018|nr:RodZ domain-containing protein [Bacillus sp. V3B]
MLQLTELGNRLKEARLAKGLSLDDLQKVTKIQKRYLIGIEEGNYSLMPGKFYIRAFIKQYAEAVELEPEELFEEFKSEIPTILNDDIPEQLSRVKTRKSISNNSSKILDLLPKLLITVFIIGIFVFAWWFIAQKYSGNTVDDSTSKESKQDVTYEESADLTTENEEEQPEENNPNEKQVKEKDENDDPTEEPVKLIQELTVTETNREKSTYELKNADKFEVKVVSTGETWVSIKNGKGDSFFEKMLEKDGVESKTVDMTGETEVIIVAGRSSETEIFVNDEKLEYAVSPTEEVLQTITIRNLKTSE